MSEAAAADQERPVRIRRRRSRPRARVFSVKALRRLRPSLSNVEAAALDLERPRTRGECREQPRPCPWVGCRHHLYLDVNPETGAIKMNFPELEPWELKHSCSLDLAELPVGVRLDAIGRDLAIREGFHLAGEEVGQALNLTRARVQQIEIRALLKIKMAAPTPDELGRAPAASPPGLEGPRRRRTRV